MQSIDSSYSVPPFPAFPSTSRYVPLGSVQETVARVCRSIDASDAVSLVIGPPGTGKSLICRLLVDHYCDSHQVVVVGDTPVESRASLLRHLLHHLGADLTTVPDGDLQLALIDRVCAQDAPEGGLLLIVDEAQSLSSEVIEAIRMVTNIMRDGKPRVVAVLCGGMKLDEILVETTMEAFTQRVATRCYLHPMNAEETRRYVTETIRSCGAEPDETITAEAIASVHHACSGVPRLINQMLTQAIDCAAEANQALITDQIVDAAWAQLQQLPSPMIEEPKIIRDAAPIEFGELDEAVDFGQFSRATSEAKTADPTDTETVRACGEGDCKTGSCQPGECEKETCDTESEIGDVTPTDVEIDQPMASFADETVAKATVQPALDEQPISAPMTTTSPAELFGDFEDEEEVEVGSGFARSTQAVQSQEPAADLEAMLHQEIIGINAMADQCQSYDFGDSPNDGRTREEIADEFDDAPEEVVEDFVTVVDDEPEGKQTDTENPVLWLPEDETVDIVEDDIKLRDDSEILVIEDEIELHRVDSASRVDAKKQTISVDFQAMLDRMRSS